MKVGFIGFGELASTLANGLLTAGLEVYTCLEGRSSRTKDLVNSTDVELCKSNYELVKTVEVVLSAVSPSQTVSVAREVGHVEGIYVDLNNVSPSTVQEALNHVGTSNTVDAAIMSSVRKKGLKVKIIASGGAADQFAQLNQYGMNIEVIGSKPGQASAIKMLRSAYTKGVSALLTESLYAAYKMGLDEEVLKYITQTEGPYFKESAVSRIKSSAYHAKRRSEEMEEVVAMIREETEPVMNQATLEFFGVLAQKLEKPSQRPTSMAHVFRMLEESNNKG
ncbi:MAG: phosphogluconate dehydrogenase [Methanobacteriales archaeon Met13]